MGRSDVAAPADRLNRDAGDGAVRGREAALPRRAALLPHGRLLRALPRRRQGRRGRAGPDAHGARSRAEDPHGRRAGQGRRRLPQASAREGPQGRHLRAAHRARARPEAPRARRRPRAHAGHAHGGRGARPAREQLPPRDPPAGEARAKRSASAWRGWTSPRAASSSPTSTTRDLESEVARIQPGRDPPPGGRGAARNSRHCSHDVMPRSDHLRAPLDRRDRRPPRAR